MRRVYFAVVLTGLGLMAVGRSQEGGLSPLFNGKDLTGWREAKGKKESLDGKTEAFKGRFKVAGDSISIDPAVKGDSYIETAKEFGKNVHIKLEFNPGPKCNNDVFLRGTKFDIVPGNKEHKDVKEGQWYTLDIIVTGDKIEHQVNGKTVRTSKAAAKATPFMLRAEFGAIQYKNISVKE